MMSNESKDLKVLIQFNEAILAELSELHKTIRELKKEIKPKRLSQS